MFFGKIDNPIGLDLSDLSVKMVQLEKKSSGLRVSAYADVLIPQGLLDHDSIQNPEALVDFLKQLMRDKSKHTGKIKGHSIVASVPESKAFVRVIKLPKLAAEELLTAVPIEAEQYIPLPLDQMQIDWQVVGEEGEFLKVFITATPTSYLESMLQVFTKAGLIVQSMEAESAAIARALLPHSQQAPGTLILDMDASRTSLIVYNQESVQFTSSIPIAGNAFTEAIANRLGVDRIEAEKLKRLHGAPLYGAPVEKTSPETGKVLSEITQAIDPILNNLYDEVKNTIRFYEQHAEAAKPEFAQINQIMICGGTAKLPNIVECLQTRVSADAEFASRKIIVAHGNSWQNFGTLQAPPFSKREALSYATAIGLALRNTL